MKCNAGRVDRALRVTLGVAIVISGLVLKSWWGAVGIIPLATGLVGWCPLYAPFGASTCRAK